MLKALCEITVGVAFEFSEALLVFTMTWVDMQDIEWGESGLGLSLPCVYDYTDQEHLGEVQAALESVGCT